jgi:hypothetical protein
MSDADIKNMIGQGRTIDNHTFVVENLMNDVGLQGRN